MLNLFFFLKFKSQLSRTQPDIVHQIDESLIGAINDAGGKITDKSLISAVLNEEKIGFWLDMYILIENLIKNTENSPVLFGYSLLLSSAQPESPELLCRYLANHSGIFADEKAAKKLLPYAIFERPVEWLKGKKRRKYGCYNYYKMSELKNFKFENKNDLDIYNDLCELLKQEKGKNVLVFSKPVLPLRGGIYKYCNEINGVFPVLTICFESIGIGALVDIWSLNVRSLSGGESTEEIDTLWEFLFKERVRDEVSEYVERCTKRFLLLVFDYYVNAARKRLKTPVLVMENIHLAENNTMNLLLNVLSENIYENRQKLLILGTADENTAHDRLQKWENVFDKKLRTDNLNNSVFIPRLSNELWEIIYAISLFSRYFSPELYLRLFEEEDKNPVMITRSFSILYSLGIIDSIREPRLMNRQFEEYAVKILEAPPEFTLQNPIVQSESEDSPPDNRPERIRAIARNRLISWAAKRNLNPCFRLLSIISGLGGVKQIDDMLLLKALTSDIVNKTISTIEQAMKNGQFEEILTAKAAVIRHIFKTSKVLNSGSEQEIEKAFSDTKAENFISAFDSYPVLNAQIIVNFCGYYLGRHDEKEAVEKAKEAIQLGQNKNSYCLPQSYRLFALVCLSKQQINETIEYLGFALASAEKIGNNHELAISAYYAAAAQFLFGDIHKAKHLAGKSIEQSLGAGHPDWADRSRFLEGRLEFELGYYNEAIVIFSDLLKEPYGSMTCEKENLLSAWIYRCKIYLRENGITKPDNNNIDTDLFEIEEKYFSGNYKKAYELSSTIKNPFKNENFLFTEKADWRSGFAQCEHLYFTHGEIQYRTINVFNSLALCRLSDNEADTKDEDAIQNIQLILRDEKLCEIDPWESFYFYAKYLILEQIGASQVDLSTAVSMAFKRLQRRAGRIEDNEMRRQYLNGPKWNSELILAAKEFRLI